MYGTLQGLLLVFAGWLVAGGASAQLGGLLDQAKELGGDSLTGLIGQQVNADTSQIEGGIGSILSMAQERLNAGDFDKIVNAIPGAGQYLETARELGVLDPPITSMNSVNAALGKLGMSPEIIGAFVPAAVDALGKVGGADVASLLSSLTG